MSVTGAVNPPNWKSAPSTTNCEMVRPDVPSFVSVAVRVCIPPTITVPKSMLVELGTSCPGATPVPDSDSATVPSEALSRSEMVPLITFAALGTKTRCKLILWPAKIVNGSVGAPSENSEVLVRALVIVTAAVPVLVAVINNVAPLPTTTLPKLSVVLLKLKSAIEDVCCLERVPALKPWHDRRLATAKVIIRPCHVFARFLVRRLCM